MTGYLEHREEGVLTITLNRPEKLNAWDFDTRVALEDLWKRTAGDRSVRCVVLTGAGRGFCAGADVTGLAGERAARGGDIEAELAFLPGRVVEVPVVVAVNGVCAGGGLHFVADADICIAARSAVFVDSHVSVGQVSGIEPASLALRAPLGLIGRMALMGNVERVDAQRALAAGLVSEVIEDDRLMDRAHEIARAISAASPAAIRATRRVLRELSDELLEKSMIRGWDAVQEHWPHPDVKEGPRAFSEKRPPRWTD